MDKSTTTRQTPFGWLICLLIAPIAHAVSNCDVQTGGQFLHGVWFSCFYDNNLKTVGTEFIRIDWVHGDWVYDANQLRAGPGRPDQSSKRWPTLWSKVSKAADRSMRMRAVTFPLSTELILWLWMVSNAVSVEWLTVIQVDILVMVLHRWFTSHLEGSEERKTRTVVFRRYRGNDRNRMRKWVAEWEYEI